MRDMEFMRNTIMPAAVLRLENPPTEESECERWGTIFRSLGVGEMEKGDLFMSARMSTNAESNTLFMSQPIAEPTRECSGTPVRIKTSNNVLFRSDGMWCIPPVAESAPIGQRQKKAQPSMPKKRAARNERASSLGRHSHLALTVENVSAINQLHPVHRYLRVHQWVEEAKRAESLERSLVDSQ